MSATTGRWQDDMEATVTSIASRGGTRRKVQGDMDVPLHFVQTSQPTGGRLHSRSSRACEASQEREREERAREAEEWANQWVAEGRMSPAERPFALALLGSSEPVEFGEDGMTAREAARRLFTARPLAPVSQELAPQAASPAAGMDSDAADFFRRRFSGLSLDEIARRMTPAT